MQKFLYTISILLCVITANAQPINHDSTYNGIGRRICEYCHAWGVNHQFVDVLLNPDQSAIAVGNYPDDLGSRFIAKVKPNGLLDETFGNQGWCGKDGISDFLDPANGVFFEGATNAACLQPDGKILVCGSNRDTNTLYVQGVNNRNISIFRVHANGRLDTNFGKGGYFIHPIIKYGFNSQRFESEAFNVDVMPSGNIVVNGWFFDTCLHNYLLYLKPNGSIDSTFGEDGFVYFDFYRYPVFALNRQVLLYNFQILPSGSIIVAGSIDDAHGSLSTAMFLAKVNSVGKIDSSFGTNGMLIQNIDTLTQQIVDLKLTADHKIVFVGSSDNIAANGSLENAISNYLVGRIDTNGNFDNTFNGTGYKVFNVNNGQLMWVPKIQEQADGKVVLMSNTLTPLPQDTLTKTWNTTFARLQQNGDLDLSFNNIGYIVLPFELRGLTKWASSFVIQADNKIVYAGHLDDTIYHYKFSFIGRLENYFSVGMQEPVTAALAKHSMVYPNPAQSILNVQYNCNNEAGMFYLYNTVGTQVMQLALPAGSNVQTATLQDLPAGVYLYKAIFKGCGAQTGKLIIKR
jgi:uncharacterized delta-60 repeat protein